MLNLYLATENTEVTEKDEKPILTGIFSVQWFFVVPEVLCDLCVLCG